jgi:peptidoglycan/LPS O-acetylase OafA/YrhL
VRLGQLRIASRRYDILNGLGLPNGMPPSKPPPLIAIDLLRFACAMLVVFYHFDVAFWSSPTERGEILLARAGSGFVGTEIVRIGWIGVELFFVISGFVIARSATGQTAASFLRRRALRLVPGAWICALVTATAMTIGGFGGTIAGPLLRSLTFWPVGEQVDGSYWTLGIECSFYAIVAIAIRLGATGEKVERISVGIGLSSTVYWVTLLLIGLPDELSPADRYVMLALLPHGCFFAIGVLIAAWHDDPSPRRFALLGLLTFTATIEIAQHALERAQDGIMASPVLAQTTFLAGVALLLLANRLQARLSNWIDSATTRTIGVLTYPLYLLHQDTGAWLLGALTSAGLSVRLATGATVSMLLLLAWLIATEFEPRLRRALPDAFRGRALSNQATKVSEV